MLPLPRLRLFSGVLCALACVAHAAESAPRLLIPTHPDPARATGAAVVIVPGPVLEPGDNTKEALRFARWLAERGIASFIAGEGPAADPVAVVKHVRASATTLKISPRRIALLGLGKGAERVAQAAYALPAAKPDDPAAAGRPDLLALVWGGSPPPTEAVSLPPTFLVGSTRTADNQGALIDLWLKTRGTRTVDGHFFSEVSADALATWPELFYNWARFNGLLTDEIRVPLKGMVYLDGHVLPHGYVILTPLDRPGVGPVIARVFNSTASAPIGEFIVPASQGAVPGRYKVDVRQNMNRWLSNSFSGQLVGGRGGNVTPEQAHFGHHRVLAPSIDDQKSFIKVRPSDRTDYIIEIKPDPAANQDLKLEVFSK
jgi:hypothetical protein